MNAYKYSFCNKLAFNVRDETKTNLLKELLMYELLQPITCKS